MSWNNKEEISCLYDCLHKFNVNWNTE